MPGEGRAGPRVVHDDLSLQACAAGADEPHLSTSSAGEGFAPKSMRLPYTGRCRTCGADLPAGTMAVYDRATKTVACLECALDPAPIEAVTGEPEAVAAVAAPLESDPEPESPPADEPEVVVGALAASAQREYKRRKNKRGTGIREAHRRLGGLNLALSDDPQSTKAWAVSARGEELLGPRLDGLAEHGVRVLHDRRIPVSSVITSARHAQRLR